MSLLDETSAYLAANGIGTVGVDLFLGFRPEIPDSVVTLYEVGGQEPVRAMRGSPGQPVAQRPRLQVVCRNTEYEYAAARSKAKDIYALLEGLGDVTMSGTKYLWIAAVAEPALLGRDDAGRVLIVANYDVIKEFS